ncbi:MAG TPA: hypothetical protein VM841_04145 [Actinomycetota bacterium]|nr:hypothetical protein [Actinomycetota bacterium]
MRRIACCVAVAVAVFVTGPLALAQRSDGEVGMEDNELHRGQTVSMASKPFEAGTTLTWSTAPHPAGCHASGGCDPPTKIATTTADAQGRGTFRWTVPRNMEYGTYEMIVTGRSRGEDARYTSQFDVVPGGESSTTGGQLPATGAGTTALFALGLMLVVAGGLALTVPGGARRGPAEPACVKSRTRA